MAAELRSETNWRRSRVTGNEDDDYHEYRKSLLDQPTTNIAYDQSRCVQDDINYLQWLPSTTDTGEVATAPLNESIYGHNLENSETNWCTRRVTYIEDDDHENRTRQLDPANDWKRIQSI